MGCAEDRIAKRCSRTFSRTVIESSCRGSSNREGREEGEEGKDMERNRMSLRVCVFVYKGEKEEDTPVKRTVLY